MTEGEPLHPDPTALPQGRPLRVLYVARAPFISGAERALMSILRHLDRDAIEPALVLGHANDTLAELARSFNIPIYQVRMPKRSWRSLPGWWRSLAAMGRVMRRFKPDVVHANDVPSCQAMCAAAGRRRVPRVVHVRWTITAAEMAWWCRAGVESVICISDYIRRSLGDPAGTPLAAARVDVVTDAVDWPAEVDDTTAPDQTIPGPNAEQRPLLGFAGQLIPSKGLDLVIEALGQLPARQRPRLLVAGRDTQRGGAYEKELRELASEAGSADSVNWLGFLHDVREMYRHVDAVVCPSREEPLGLVPLEAAQFGRPCLATRTGGLAETVEHERTGWLVEPTVDAWRAALAALPEREHLQRIGRAAWDHTRQERGPDRYQQRLMAVYASLVHGLER